MKIFQGSLLHTQLLHTGYSNMKTGSNRKTPKSYSIIVTHCCAVSLTDTHRTEGTFPHTDVGSFIPFADTSELSGCSIWMNRQCSWMPEMMTNADSQMMAADVPFDIQQIEGASKLRDTIATEIWNDYVHDFPITEV
uniref:Uncharacterized protein n=1 Tax=Tanacetum cinerariifolium TaxID=118510 RepID=A0A6L2JZZ2_TANCI|nr:hypothetical protein [Tanacetum cinerariifolium]